MIQFGVVRRDDLLGSDEIVENEGRDGFGNDGWFGPVLGGC